MDGLVGGLKPLLDALVRRSGRHPFGVGLIEDDDPGHLVELQVRAARGKRGQGFTSVVIIELPELGGGAVELPVQELGDEEAA
jgi:hypothetical protein